MRNSLSRHQRRFYAAAMVTPRLAPLTLAACLAALALPGTARAEFAVCNQSFDVVNVAIGQDAVSYTHLDVYKRQAIC